MSTGRIDRYRRMIGAFALFEGSVRADGLPLAVAFARHLAELDVEDDIPSAAVPAWRKFLSEFLGIADLAGVHLSEHCVALGQLPGEETARALAMLAEVHRAARLGLAALEETYAAAMGDAARENNID